MYSKNLLVLLIFLFTLSFTYSQEATEKKITEVENDDVPFVIIEEAPVFPGCVGSRTEKKNCFNRNMRKHIMENFNASLAEDLGLTPGYKTIYAQFSITKKGTVEIKDIRAPHAALKRETKRIIELLPKMEPGKQKGKSVNVPYMLPIKFYVEAATSEEESNSRKN